jgi:hypothetical protein
MSKFSIKHIGWVIDFLESRFNNKNPKSLDLRFYEFWWLFILLP